MRDSGTSYVPHLLLTSLIAIWAGSFVVAKVTMITVTPFALVTSRFVIGCLRPAVLPAHAAGLRQGTFGPGVLAGLVLAVPYFLRMYGVRETTASMGGFVTGLIVLLVAVGGALFFGARLGRATILALVIGVSGIVTLCVAGDADDGNQTNSLRGVLRVGSAVGFAAHILLSHYGGKLATAPFTFWQLAFTGAVPASARCSAGSAWTASRSSGPTCCWRCSTSACWPPASRSACRPRCSRGSPTHVALLFALQPLFAALPAGVPRRPPRRDPVDRRRDDRLGRRARRARPVLTSHQDVARGAWRRRRTPTAENVRRQARVGSRPDEGVVKFRSYGSTTA